MSNNANVKMRREIGKEYNNYDEYICHQKEKTLDPNRRKKWLNEEWNQKIIQFNDIFKPYIENKILIPKMKCICLGARTGQEVIALQKFDLDLDVIGIDIVPYEPYVILGDIHNINFPNNSFDFIFTNIFDHSIYPNKFIEEIERILKPNGHVLMQLQLNVKSDIYAENDINHANDVINLFNNSKCIINKSIKFTSMGMNWEIVMKKN